MWAMARPRTGAGTSAQPGWTARAARAAAANVPASPSAISATVSLVRAGFAEVIRPPGAPVTGTPAMTEVTGRVIIFLCAGGGRGASRVRAASPTLYVT